jgi:YgiT-type zinc finger domain-containing protein
MLKISLPDNEYLRIVVQSGIAPVEAMKTDLLICDNCGKPAARVRKSSRCYGRGKNLLVIENVPVVSCHNCGESYMTAETVHRIEKIRLGKRSVKARRVGVASYAKAG